MHGMKRPNIQEQMPNPMTLEQVGMILALDMSLRERAASHPLAYLVLVDPLVNPTAAMCSEQIGPPGKSQGVLLGPECGM